MSIQLYFLYVSIVILEQLVWRHSMAIRDYIIVNSTSYQKCFNYFKQNVYNNVVLSIDYANSRQSEKHSINYAKIVVIVENGVHCAFQSGHYFP